MDLIEASHRFLRKAIEEFDQAEYSFAIVHCITAVELAFKARLAMVNPVLVYADIDAKRLRGSYTVGLRKSLQRLRNLGINIASEDAQLVNDVATLRNQIIHNVPQYKRGEAAEKLGATMSFLGDFLSTKLDQDLRDVLDAALYRVASEVMELWSDLVEDSRNQAREAADTVFDQACPVCAVTQVVTQVSQDEATCHFCASELIVGPCAICGEVALTNPQDRLGDVYHWDCLNDYAVDYLTEFHYDG